MDFKLINIENMVITKWDFDVIKVELQHKLDICASLGYTDVTIKNAKKDKAPMNKYKQTIETAGKEYKARYLAPYEEIKSRVQGLVDMIEK